MPSLFARLRPAAPVANAAYAAAVKTARAAHWYRAGEVPDTMDGRFGLLATIVALLSLRLEQAGDAGQGAAVALTEAFISDMDAQMREQGFDATLGKHVRHMVGSLASRVDRWRRVMNEGDDWTEATRLSLYRDAAVRPAALDHSSTELWSLWSRLGASELAAIVGGSLDMSDFAHRLGIESIRDGDRLDLSADEAERSAIADRLSLISLERLDAHVVFARDGKTVRCEGRVKARVTQACIASGEPVAASVDEAFAVAFAPAPVAAQPEPEVELGADDLDTVFHDGLMIDLGGAIVDTLALALDPYPRGPAAEDALKAAGVLREEEAGPFAILARLKRGGLPD